VSWALTRNGKAQSVIRIKPPLFRKEAAFFNSKEELFEKVTYYLGHEEERKNIAQAGRDRCLRSGYSNNEILNSMLQFIEKLSEQY